MLELKCQQGNMDNQNLLILFSHCYSSLTEGKPQNHQSIEETAAVTYVRFGDKWWREDWVSHAGRIVSWVHQHDRHWVGSDRDSAELWL